MPPNKRKHRKENPNAIEPSQKRAKTGTSAADVDVEPAPKPVKFEGGKKKGRPAPAKPLSKKQLLSDKSLFPDQQDRNIEAPLYELLGSEDPNERLQAADVIISKLLHNDGVSESSLDRHLEKRLFRGLASSRKASRLGFSIVLTEILQQLWGEKDLCGEKYRGLTFDFVLNTLTEKTKPVGNIAGQEEKDHYFGQLFGIECFVRAKILFDDVTRWNTILALLIKLAKKKVWLKPQCAWIILQTVPQMDQQIAEETLRRLDEAGWAKTPDAVAITVVFMEKFPKIKLPSKSWRDFLSSKYLGELPAVLKDSGKQESKQETNGEEPAQKQKQASWTAQLHFVWDIILAHYVKLASAEPRSASDQFKQFWSRVVDQGFFSKTASEPQKFTGFMIFQKFLEGGISHHHITHNVFSQNLLTCLMNQAAKQDRYLHRAATKALKAIEQAVDADRDLVPVIIQFLLGKQGAYNFDQRSNSKTVDKLLHLTSAQHAQEVIETLRQLVLKSEGDGTENHILVYADYLFRLASIVPTEADAKTASKGSVGGPALQEFARLAYPRASETVPGLSEKTRPILRQKLTAALAKFVKRPEDFAEFCNAIMLIDSSSVEMDEELQTELLEALEKLQQLTNPKQAKGRKSNAYQGLALLYAVAILQLYNAEPDAVEILHDLRQCHEKLLSKQKGEDGDVSALLVEILLAMVARPSSLMRQTADRVFEAFTNLMTEEALTLLTDTLAAKEDAEGLRALFDTDADMEDLGEAAADEEEEDESELGSDVEFVDAEETQEAEGEMGSEENVDGEESSEEDEDADDELNEDEAKLKALDDDLAKLLNSHRLDKDKDAASSDDDSDMSDSEMIALDEQLAAAFKSRVKNGSKKKENKDAKETVVNFKHRTLDLLAIFARKEAANPLVYKLLLPLLQMMRTTKTKDLARKAGNIIAEMSKAQRKAKAGSSKDEENEDQGVTDSDEAGSEEYLTEQTQLLEAIHDEMAHDESHAFAKSASNASLLVVGDILSKDVGYFQVIWDNYGGLAMKWAMYGGFQFSTIIADWTQWIQAHPALVARRIDAVPGKADDPTEADDEGEDDG
ncbi:putative dna polymerase v [Diaporthe ampelina]|uniref:Putative dna polymerase v n=1 Tax=Diaporthe ampelina TaxID=1214573 RepID=A0A0G2FLH0_9PEZI|nr:putative dna polymerase v [Diaporthe ampelina]